MVPTPPVHNDRAPLAVHTPVTAAGGCILHTSAAARHRMASIPPLPSHHVRPRLPLGSVKPDARPTYSLPTPCQYRFWLSPHSSTLCRCSLRPLLSAMSQISTCLHTPF